MDKGTRIDLDNLRPNACFYTCRQLGAEALGIYTRENSFKAYVTSNFLDRDDIVTKVTDGTFDPARFRNPGQPRRHQLIPRKPGTARWPGSRLVTKRPWTAADLAFTSGKLRITRRRFIRRPEVRFRDVDIVVQGYHSRAATCSRAGCLLSTLQLRVVHGQFIFNLDAPTPITRPPFPSALPGAATPGVVAPMLRPNCVAMHTIAKLLANDIATAEAAANNGVFDGFTIDHLKQIAASFVWWPYVAGV